MRNPFRRNKKSAEFKDRFTASTQMRLEDELHAVRITVEYNNPRAAIAALYKLARPPYLTHIAAEIGANVNVPAGGTYEVDDDA